MLLFSRHKDMLEYAIFRLTKMQESLEFHYGFSSRENVKTLEVFKEKLVWYKKCLDKLGVVYINNDTYKLIYKLANQQCLDMKQILTGVKDVSM